MRRLSCSGIQFLRKGLVQLYRAVQVLGGAAGTSAAGTGAGTRTGAAAGAGAVASAAEATPAEAAAPAAAEDSFCIGATVNGDTQPLPA